MPTTEAEEEEKEAVNDGDHDFSCEYLYSSYVCPLDHCLLKGAAAAAANWFYC